METSVNAPVNPKASALPTTRVASKPPSGAVAIPAAVTKEEGDVIKWLNKATTMNPFLSSDPLHDKSLMETIRDANKDGVIDRNEFAKIMKYYGIDEVTDEAWDAFTGGKDKITLKDLIRSLKFFVKFRTHVKAYSFKYFLGLDEVYIIGGKEVGAKLRALGLTSSPNNPAVKGAWERAKALTGGEVNDKTWDWFGTMLMAEFVDQLKDAGEFKFNKRSFSNWVRDRYDFNDIDLEHSLMRQLFGEYVVRWAQEGTGISGEEWDALERDNDTIKDIEKRYGVSLEGIKLFGKGSENDVREIFRLYREDPIKNKKTILDKIHNLKEMSIPHAVPKAVV